LVASKSAPHMQGTLPQSTFMLPFASIEESFYEFC
jgi:hypothetical protein